jgi:predicted TIM-barrel fold metal-dependent hydrolase
MSSSPVIDIHTHLAGIGHGDTGCFIAPGKHNSLLYGLLRWKLGIAGAHKRGRLDQEYRERLEKDVAEAATQGVLQAAVVFAHDRVYREDGTVHDDEQELYVPNEYLFTCAERSGGKFLPAASVHPYRKDALDETAKWIERGAVALKWLPNSQGMDPRDPRCLAVYRLLAERKVPLISHTGGEHTVRVIRPEFGDPGLLQSALDAGVTVIMAHCATKSGLFDGNWFPSFAKLARRHPNAYGDTSAFNTPGRVRWHARVLREEGLAEKLVHGSDFPVPPNAWWSLFKLGWSRTRMLEKTWSFLARDVLIKRALGYPNESFTRGAGLLAPGSLERWGVGKAFQGGLSAPTS